LAIYTSFYRAEVGSSREVLQNFSVLEASRKGQGRDQDELQATVFNSQGSSAGIPFLAVHPPWQYNRRLNCTSTIL